MILNGVCRLTAAAAVFLIALCSGVQAQYPNKAIQVAIPFGPGPSDLMTRITASCLSNRYKQPVVVVNKPGANGVIGATYVKNSAADGYTLGFAASTMVTDLAMSDNPTFDVRRDLEPITKIVFGVQGVFVNSELPIQSMADLVAYAKANPGRLNYGTVGIGSVNHLSVEALAITSGTRLVHVPYPKGNAAFMTALMTGEIQMAMTDVNAAQSLGDTGKIRLLAILAAQRLPSRPAIALVPDTVPGMANYIGNLWYGYFAPPQTARSIIDRTYNELKTCMADEEVRGQFKKLGYKSSQIVANRPEEFKASILDDVVKITDLVKRANIRRE